MIRHETWFILETEDPYDMCSVHRRQQSARAAPTNMPVIPTSTTPTYYPRIPTSRDRPFKGVRSIVAKLRSCTMYFDDARPTTGQLDQPFVVFTNSDQRLGKSPHRFLEGANVVPVIGVCNGNSCFFCFFRSSTHSKRNTPTCPTGR